MTNILFAQPHDNSLRDNLSKLGESMFGNGAQNEMHRQEALKGQRQNKAAMDAAAFYRRGDMVNANAASLENDPSFTGMGAQNLARQALTSGDNFSDPKLATAALGAGHSAGGTVPIVREEIQQKDRAQKYASDRAASAQEAIAARQIRSDESKQSNTFTNMLNPEGRIVPVPHNQVQEAVQRGYHVPPTDSQALWMELNPPQKPSAAPVAQSDPTPAPSAPASSAAPTPAAPTPAASAAPTAPAASAAPTPAATPSTPEQPAPAAQVDPRQLTGEPYLKTLPPAFAAQLRAIERGDQPFPNDSRNAYQQRLKRMLNQAYPELNAFNYPARVAFQKDLTSGAIGKTLMSYNQLIPHIGSASDKAQALDNRNYPAMNAIENWLAQAQGDPRIKDFGNVRDTVATETAKLLRGAGSMSLEEQTRWIKNLSAADSPASLNTVLHTLADELAGARMDSIKHQYRLTMGRDPPELLSPESIKAMARIRARAPKPANAAPAATAKVPTMQVSPEGGAPDRNAAALKWANENPTDPRAVEIKQYFGAQ